MTEWLESADLPFQPKPPDIHTKLAIRAWNMMGGQIDWNGLETVADILGINDIERLVAQLETIRNHGRQSQSRD